MKDYNFIHILGGSGSGTTTLGKKIATEYGYMHLDADDYYWNNIPEKIPFTNAREPEERLLLLQRDINKYDKVVLSGALGEWGKPLKKKFDLIIFLDVSTETRIERIRKREKERFGNRVMYGGDMYKQHIDFLEWAREYEYGDESIRSYRQHKKWLKETTCQVINISEGEDIDEILKAVFSK